MFDLNSSRKEEELDGWKEQAPKRVIRMCIDATRVLFCSNRFQPARVLETLGFLRDKVNVSLSFD